MLCTLMSCWWLFVGWSEINLDFVSLLALLGRYIDTSCLFWVARLAKIWLLRRRCYNLYWFRSDVKSIMKCISSVQTIVKTRQMRIIVDASAFVLACILLSVFDCKDWIFASPHDCLLALGLRVSLDLDWIISSGVPVLVDNEADGQYRFH